MRDHNFWVYITTNDHDTVLYTGEIPGFTADFRCRKLLYYEHCTDVLGTIAREKQLKNWSRKKKVTLIATMKPAVENLAPEVLGDS